MFELSGGNKMAVTTRTLSKWRREALIQQQFDWSGKTHESIINQTIVDNIEANKRILILTQELLDQHLIERS